MRLIVAETDGGQTLSTHEFNQAIIKVGRDRERCQLVFDQTVWPMVSRLHAEFRLADGRCFLTDLNSTQGTFVNAQQITVETPVEIGALIQFGLNGPRIRIELIDTRSLPQKEREPVHAAPIPPTPAPAVADTRPRQDISVPLPAQQTSAVLPILTVEGGATTEPGRQFPVNEGSTILGRDAAADVSVNAAAAVVSRRHAEIRRASDGTFLLVDLKSFNGTWLNGRQINQPTLLRDGDRIQLSLNGPCLRYSDSQKTAPPAPAQPPSPSFTGAQPSEVSADFDFGTFIEMPSAHQTLVFHRSGLAQSEAVINEAQPQLLAQFQFDGKQKLSVGRAPQNDIQLDGLLISNYHARFINAAGQILVEDTGSTNGVYVNGVRLADRRPLQPEDIVQIGPFFLKADMRTGVAIFDTRSKARIDAVDVSYEVPASTGSGRVTLLDHVSLTIQPNEFVGLLGWSGSGKSTLMNVLNGMRQTTSGQVLLNNLDLYQNRESLKQFIGYVPQDDIIHRELTVYRTLYYVARLRLSTDVRREDIDQIIAEVLEVTGLSDRRDLRVSQLSGGQRKRVSIAVELITKPSVIFLDEPTSGLDPATQDQIMKLFRQIAETGRTVILTTHSMQDIHLFDKIIMLMRGKMIFYGTPDEALKFVGADDFLGLYEKLEEPIELGLSSLPVLPPKASAAQRRAHDQYREQILETAADSWRQRFQQSDPFQRSVSQPLSAGQPTTLQRKTAKHRLGIFGALRQWFILVSRYLGVLLSDKLNLLILLAQAPIIAIMTYLVVDSHDPRDFLFFVLALVTTWFGASIAATEIIKERAIYRRERMVNLSLLPYVGSKLFVLAIITGVQTFMLFATLKLLHFAGAMKFPGLIAGIPQLITMLFAAVVGVALGLFVSALVKTPAMATSMVPLILIPQILFCGLVGLPTGASRVVGAVMPATWSFDEIKRLSSLDTLKPEGSNPEGPNQGRGLLKQVETENQANIDKARKEIENYKKDSSQNLKNYETKVRDYLSRGASGREPSAALPPAPVIGPAPAIPDAKKLSDDLSDYVNFKHPWGGIVLDFAILVLMFLFLTMATLITLWKRDIN